MKNSIKYIALSLVLLISCNLEKSTPEINKIIGKKENTPKNKDINAVSSQKFIISIKKDTTITGERL